jgi:Biopolymer transport protein ExbD/TolR
LSRFFETAKFSSATIGPIPPNCPASIREYLSSGSEKRVYVKADGRVHYGTVVEVLDGVRSAGIEQVGFLVEQRRGDDAPSH